MASTLVVHFVGGSELRMVADIDSLGRNHVTANGMVEIPTPDATTAKLWVNPDQITYVEEFATPDAAARHR